MAEVAVRAVPSILVRLLAVDYTVVRAAATGDWIAVGTVYRLEPPSPPAWLLVGLGSAPDDAVDDLRRQAGCHLERAGPHRP
jgi:hypothetical protein